MSRQESLRKKANCRTCNLFKPIKSKDNCQNCWHKIKRKTQPDFFLRTRHTEITQRCTNINNERRDVYFGKKFCSREEFLNMFKEDSEFNRLFIEWKDSGYDNRFVPSVDRIDNSGDYTLDNIRFITHSENCSKDQDKIETIVTDIEGNFLGEFESLNSAVNHFKVQQSNAWKVMNGQRKHTTGLIFKRKSNPAPPQL